jgi:pSer/pThr/pTyr-binding forkhead associated (FHA) protein
VSRVHAEFKTGTNAFLVIDRGSTNGTMVNGTRITAEYQLSDGDIISFGSTHVRFEAS